VLSGVTVFAATAVLAAPAAQAAPTTSTGSSSTVTSTTSSAGSSAVESSSITTFTSRGSRIVVTAIPQATCKKKPNGFVYVTRFSLCGASTWEAREYLDGRLVGWVQGRYTVTGAISKAGARKIAIVVGLDRLKSRGTMKNARLTVTLPCKGGACSVPRAKSKTVSGWRKHPASAFAFLAPKATEKKAANARFSVRIKVTSRYGSTRASAKVAGYRCGPASFLPNGHGCIFKE
jgi:hypothetical protein